MDAIAERQLNSMLVVARKEGATELRLVSGSVPMLVVKDEVRSLAWQELTATMVQKIHLTCLRTANEETPAGDMAIAYRLRSKRVGSMRCAYAIRGRGRVLRIFLEDDPADETVAGNHQPSPGRWPAEAQIEKDENSAR